MKRIYLILLLLGTLFSPAAGQGLQSFHLWQISEIYSNYDGKVQFIEFFCPPGNDGEGFLAGHALVATQGANTHTFNFTTNLVGATGGKRFLIATQSYTFISGLPTPDYVVPDKFFYLPNGSVNYGEGTDLQSYTSFPTNPAQSLQYPGATTAAATPTNFAGTTSSITPDVTTQNVLPSVPKGTITIETTTIATGLSAPLGLEEPDDDSGRFFIHDQSGKVFVYKDGGILPTLMLDVTSRVVGMVSNSERGLIGFATHPNFATNPKIYTYTSEAVSGTPNFTNSAGSQDHHAVIAEWTLTGNSAASDTANIASRREILRIGEPQSNHNGGTMRFGPDGFLYLALGDGGASNDSGSGHSAGGNGQDINNVYGKILRIDVDKSVGALGSSGEYTIPPTNPFVGVAGVDEIFVYGLRNPFTFVFDKGQFTTSNFAMYIGDVGQGRIEELNLVTPANIGANFGWPRKEGSYAFNQSGGTITLLPSTPPAGTLTDPLAEYDHHNGSGTVDNGVSIIAGGLYRGTQIPELTGKFVFGDYLNSSTGVGRLWYLDTGNVVKELILGSPERSVGILVKGFGQDRLGNLYICGSTSFSPISSTGVVMRIRALNAVTASESWMFYR